MDGNTVADVLNTPFDTFAEILWNSLFDTLVSVIIGGLSVNRLTLVSCLGTGRTLSSANTRPDCLISFKMSLCSFDPGTTGLSGDTIFLASRKFILLVFNNVEHIDKIGCGVGGDVCDSYCGNGRYLI